MEFLVFIGLVLGYFYLRSPSRKGRVGERRVKRKLESYARGIGNAKVLHDLTLRTPDGTTQVDHVLICAYGVIVVETKNLKGWIFGEENQRKWTQVVYRRKNSFMNPLRQNYKHLKAVQRYTGARSEQLISLVVFAGDSKFKTSVPANVMHVRKLKRYLNQRNTRLLSDSEIETFVDYLCRPEAGAKDRDGEHLSNLRANKKSPMCPRCGAIMVLRKAKRGKGRGQKFFGCSDFPICRGTRPFTN